MAELTPEQEEGHPSGSSLDLPAVDGPCWATDCLVISREWIAFRQAGGTGPWKVIFYAAVSSVRPAAFSNGVTISGPDGCGVVVNQNVLDSPQACALLAEGLAANPAAGPAAADILEDARLNWETALKGLHTVDSSGITHTFRFRRRLHAFAGVAGVAGGAAVLAGAMSGSLAGGGGRWALLILGPGAGLAIMWEGVRQFRVGVQVSGGKLTIRNALSTRTINAGDIRDIALEMRTVNAAGEICWTPRVELTDGNSIWIENLEGGDAPIAASPELAAILREIKALLGLS